jgi:outer membrane PBP1 activator LpoA protein
MKTMLIVILLACALSGGCSRSEKQPDVAAQTTPNQNLKTDAERLQQATAKAAEERKREQAHNSPTPSAPQP